MGRSMLDSDVVDPSSMLDRDRSDEASGCTAGVDEKSHDPRRD